MEKFNGLPDAMMFRSLETGETFVLNSYLVQQRGGVLYRSADDKPFFEVSVINLTGGYHSVPKLEYYDPHLVTWGKIVWWEAKIMVNEITFLRVPHPRLDFEYVPLPAVTTPQ